MPWKSLALSLLLHAALVVALAAAGLAWPRPAPRARTVELTVLPVPRPPAASPAPLAAPAPTTRPSTDDGDRPSTGGARASAPGRGRAARRATPPPAIVPPAEEDLVVPHVEGRGDLLAVTSGELGLATGVGVGTGRGIGAGGAGGTGDGRGRGRASRRWPRPIDPPDHRTLPYPRQAIAGRRSGTVALLLLVAPDGQVREVKVTKPLGYGFDEIAILEASKLRFTPGLDYDGTPIAMYVGWKFSFEPP